MSAFITIFALIYIGLVLRDTVRRLNKSFFLPLRLPLSLYMFAGRD